MTFVESLKNEGFGGPNLAFLTPQPASQPAALNATFPTPDSFVLNISSLVVGRNYMIQSTTNLASVVWTTETNFVATQSAATFTNSATNYAQKYYRGVGY